MYKEALQNIKSKGYDSMSKGFIDYMKVKVLKPCELLSEKLQYLQNSNAESSIIKFSNIDVTFTYQQSPTGFGLQGSIQYNGVCVPIMYYEEYMDHTKELANCEGKIILYGGYFRLEELWYFKFSGIKNNSNHGAFWDWFVNEFGEGGITRIDYKRDFFKKKGKIDMFNASDVTKIRKNTKLVEYKRGENDLESFSAWSRDSLRYLIRGYDKLLDIQKKQKMVLYGDYLEFESVHRLELEFLSHFCRKVDEKRQYKLNELRGLLWKIKDFINKENEIPIYETKEKIDLSDVADKLKYVRNTKGYIKWIMQNNVNIFAVISECYEELWYTRERIKKDLEDFNTINKNWLFSYEELNNLSEKL